MTADEMIETCSGAELMPAPRCPQCGARLLRSRNDVWCSERGWRVILTDYRIVCDVCGDRLTLLATRETDAISEARRHGWSVDTRHDRCPDCRGKPIPLARLDGEQAREGDPK